MGFFQTGSPLPLSMHHSASVSPSATLRKMRLPQMMGVDPERSGMASFHTTFSVWLQRAGRSDSPLTPLSDGPRHCGQFSANPAAASAAAHAASAIDFMEEFPL